jgi:hypothetical protein
MFFSPLSGLDQILGLATQGLRRGPYSVAASRLSILDGSAAGYFPQSVQYNLHAV